MKSKKSLIHLTNSNYTTLLRSLGFSEKPLSSYQIKKKMEKQGLDQTSSPYVYEMIKNLNPDTFDDQIVNLFRWTEIPGRKIAEQNLVRKLKKYLGKKFEHNLDFEVKFEKNEFNDELIIINPFETVATIKLYKQLDFQDDSKNEISKRRVENRYLSPRLIIIHSENVEEVYLNKKNDHIQLNLASHLDPYSRIDYQIELTKSSNHALNVEYPERVKEIENQIDNIYEKQRQGYIKNGDPVYPRSPVGDEFEILRKELNEIFLNSRYHKYYLNVRGLIIYILGEQELELRDKRVHNKRIDNVLTNLANNYLSQFPFLLHYEDFEKCYSIINQNKKYYGVEILKKTAEELRYQINSSEYFLSFWVTKRYFQEITLYLLYGINEGLLDDKPEYGKLIQNYSLRTLNLIKEYLAEEHEKIETQINYIDTKYIDAEELMRGYTFPLS